MAEDWTYDGPEWIYLQPAEDADGDRREWYEDAINIPTEERQDQTEPTDCPYVRGDIHDAVVKKLAERDAEAGRLRKAAEELIEVAELRGDNELPHPANDPLLWTARMQTAWNELEATLTPTPHTGGESSG